MEELNAILGEATAAISQVYFKLPVESGEAIIRERAYCYELYHQILMRWHEAIPFTLSGEVDKRAHPVLKELGVRLAIPDLLVHVPGSMAGNGAIIEVKPDTADPRGIAKDLTTLKEFREVVGYQRAIYLFYGGLPIKIVREVASNWKRMPRIELWLHKAVGESASLIDVLGAD